MIKLKYIFLISSLSFSAVSNASWVDLLKEGWKDPKAALAKAKKASGKITVCFASEKKKMPQVVAPYLQKELPRVKVNYVFKGSGQLMQDMKNGNPDRCDIVSPASQVSAMAWSGYSTKPKKLFYSPLILVMKKKAADVIKTKLKDKEILLSNLTDFVGARWKKFAPEAGIKGKIRIAFTNPELSNSGLVTLMSYVYTKADKYESIDADDVAEVEDSLKLFWKKTSHRESSTGNLTNLFMTSGRFSGIFTYENLLPKIVHKLGADNLTVIYPEYAVMNNHPMYIVSTNVKKKKAAEAFTTLLLTQNLQSEFSSKLGFRPSHPEAKIYFDAETKKLIEIDMGEVDLPTDRGIVDEIIETVTQ